MTVIRALYFFLRPDIAFCRKMWYNKTCMPIWTQNEWEGARFMPETMIGNGIRYTEIHDPKFRSCLLTIQFHVPRNAQTAPVHALLPDLLTASSADYPSVNAMTLRLESLYAADFLAKVSLCGDGAVLDFTASMMVLA